MTSWALAIDFGTTNTAAAACPVGEPHRAREIKLSSISTVMPSGVLEHPDGRLLAGEIARNSVAAAAPGAYIRTPKKWFQYGAVVLGDSERPIADLVAAVFRDVAIRASRQQDGVSPAELRLTHPATWATKRKQILLDAALAAGLPDPKLVSEPVAAATYYAYSNRGEVASGPVGTYDLGGGTLDVAILEPDDQTFRQLATDGIDPLGGESFDALLEDFVKTQLEVRDRMELWNVIQEQPGARRTLFDQIRNAKHALSEWPTADIAVAAGADSEVIAITRGEFNTLIKPRVMDSLVALRRALETAGLTSVQLGRLYLVGGSSHIPLVAELLEKELGVRPSTFDDPKTVTCLGALHTIPGVGPRPTPPKSQLRGSEWHIGVRISVAAINALVNGMGFPTATPKVDTYWALAKGRDLADSPSVGLQEDPASLFTPQDAVEIRTDPTEYFKRTFDMPVDSVETVDAYEKKALLVEAATQTWLIMDSPDGSRILEISGFEPSVARQIIAENSAQSVTLPTLSDFGFSVVPWFPKSLPFRQAEIQVTWEVGSDRVAWVAVNQVQGHPAKMSPSDLVESLLGERAADVVRQERRTTSLFGGHSGPTVSGILNGYAFVIGATSVGRRIISVTAGRVAILDKTFRRAPSAWEQCNPLIVYVSTVPASNSARKPK